MLIGLCGIEFFYMLHVFIFEPVDNLVCALGVFLVEVVGDFNERIGCSTHG